MSDWKDKMPGGLGDKKNPSDFDPEALAQGLVVEMEHTTDPLLAQEIAMDHLTEDPCYYEKLEQMEKQAQSAAKLASAILVRDAAVRLAAAGQATFWLEVDGAQNHTVREYEDPSEGNSYIAGEFVLLGTLHVKPQGTTWDASFPVHHKVSVQEHPASGSYSFTVRDDDPTGRLLDMALLTAEAEKAVRKSLGKLDFVAYGDPKKLDPVKQAHAWLAQGLKQRKLPISSGDDRRATPDEFMLMNPAPIKGQWQFKHVDSRNYVFVDSRDGRITVPKTDKPFFRGTFDKFGSKTAEINAPSAVIVGDMFYSSWGYDQTNVDYYQVVKTAPAMIVLREVKKKVIRGQGQPTEFVIPLANQFVGEPLRKKLMAYNGRAMVRLNSYSSAYKWDGKEKGQTGTGFGH